MAATFIPYSHHNPFFSFNNPTIIIQRECSFPALITPPHPATFLNSRPWGTKEEDVRAKKQGLAATKSLKLCCWIKPAFGWTKLNTDGSVRDISGCGGLLRDHKSLPICGFLSKAPSNNIFIVELWAIWRGLNVALRLGIRNIWVESDSLSVVKTINREQAYSVAAFDCLKLVWDFMGKFERCHVTHAWREVNRAADQLAKMAVCCSDELTVLGSDLVIWPLDFSSSLYDIIREDGQGKIYVRG